MMPPTRLPCGTLREREASRQEGRALRKNSSFITQYGNTVQLEPETLTGVGWVEQSETQQTAKNVGFHYVQPNLRF